MRAPSVLAARLLAIVASAVAAGAAAAPPPAVTAQQLSPVTVTGERPRTEGAFSPFVYEALGATPRVALPLAGPGATRRAADGATAVSPFVYEHLGATPPIRLPARTPTVADTAQ